MPHSKGAKQLMCRTVMALVLMLHWLGMPVVALGVLGLAVVALVLVHRLGFVLGVAIVALVPVRRLRLMLRLACAKRSGVSAKLSLVSG